MRQSSRVALVTIMFLAWAGVLAAIGPTSAFAATAGSEASPAQASAGTADAGLTLTASAPAVQFGAQLTLTGQLSVPGASLTLSRLTSADADFVVVQTLTADAAGSVSWSSQPQVSATYRLDYAGDATWAPSRAEVAVAVMPVLSLAARLQKPIFAGDRVTFRLALAPAHPGATVELQRLDGGTWVTFQSVTLDALSRARVRWAADPTMRVSVRALFAGDADYSAATSRATSMFVNPANAHRVPRHYRHYIVIVIHEYRLYYYERGVMVRRFSVALGRPGYRTPVGTFHIWGKRKPGGGPLGACVMFYTRQRGLAIHGTDQPYLLNDPLPRDYSHGCARMYNTQALWLYARCPVGTTVRNLR
ncbi:MAG: L,D-transpeptidase family protein [Actinomycetes bacterium]